jgi:hypothetical protein
VAVRVTLVVPVPAGPQRPYSYGVFRWAFEDWQARIGLHDGTGRAVRVTPHQLGHTLVISPPVNPLRDVKAA